MSSLCEAIAWTNFDLWLTAPLGTNCSDFLVVWQKVFGNDMQIVVILSRPQRVKKLHFLTHVIITIIQTRCINGSNMCFRPILLTWLLEIRLHHRKYDILRNYYKMLQSFTEILFSLVWWQVWNIKSYHILTKGSLWWNTSDYHR